MRRTALALRTKATQPKPRTPDATSARVGRSPWRSSRTRIDATVIDGQTVVVNTRMPDAAPLDYSTPALLRTAALHEIVNACIRARADALIAPTLLVERKQPDGTFQSEPDHPLIALFRAPGPSIDPATLWRCLSVSWDAVGDVYLEPIYATGGMLAGLNPINPAYITPRYDATGALDHYEWWPGYGDRVNFQPDELIVRRRVSWADPAPLISALAAVDSDWSQTDYIRAFFANAGVPSGILKVKGTWSKDRAADLQSRWTEKYGRYGGNAGGPAVLDDNADYQRVGAQLDEIESESLRAIAESRISMVFGVPPLIIYSYVGLLRATYSNLGEAWDGFWMGTATTLTNEWAAWLTRALLPAYEDPAAILMGDVRVRFDKTGLGPYIEDATTKINQLKDGLAAGGVKLNEYRAALGLEPDPDGDVYYIPSTVTVVPATKATRANSRQKGGANGAVATMPRLVPVPDTQPAQVKARQTVTERHVQQYIEGEYAKANRLLRTTGDVEATIAALDEALDDGLDLAAILAPGVRKETERAYVAARRQKAVVRPQTLTDAIDRAVEQMAARARDMARTTKEAIAGVIRAGLDLLTAGRDAAPARAETIAVHEQAEAKSEGSLTGFNDGGVDTVRWVLGPNPCEICIPLDGQTYKLADVIAGRTPTQPQHVRCECSWDGVAEGEGEASNE